MVDNNGLELNELTESVLKSPKYKNVCVDFIRRIGTRELSVRPNLKAALKATKNKLHQVGGAYFCGKVEYSRWMMSLRKAAQSSNPDELRGICLEIMDRNSATRERLAIINEFYQEVFSLLPPIRSVADIACGFHPLAIPWMPLKRNTKYCAYDIYGDLTEFVNEFMSLTDIDGHCECLDVIHSTPQVKVDLAFLMKALPGFDKVDKLAGFKLMEELDAKHLVVSFPIRSIGGKNKDMWRNYGNRFYKLVENTEWRIQRLEFRTELVFLVAK